MGLKSSNSSITRIQRLPRRQLHRRAPICPACSRTRITSRVMKLPDPCTPLPHRNNRCTHLSSPIRPWVVMVACNQAATRSKRWGPRLEVPASRRVTMASRSWRPTFQPMNRTMETRRPSTSKMQSMLMRTSILTIPSGRNTAASAWVRTDTRMDPVMSPHNLPRRVSHYGQLAIRLHRAHLHPATSTTRPATPVVLCPTAMLPPTAMFQERTRPLQ